MHSSVLAGKKVTPEVLRVTYGIHLYNATGDVHYVKESLGLNDAVSVLRFLKNEQPVKIKSSTVMENLFQIKNKEDNYINEYPLHIMLIALNKVEYWEYRFFCEAMEYQYNKMVKYRQKTQFNMWRVGERDIDAGESEYFISSKLRILGVILRRYSEVTNTSLQKGIGEEGKEGDFEYLLEAVSGFTSLYMDLIFWKMEFKTISVDYESREFYEYIVRFGETILTLIDEWYGNIIDGAVQLFELSEGMIQKEDVKLDLYLNLNSIDMEEFSAKVNKFLSS